MQDRAALPDVLPNPADVHAHIPVIPDGHSIHTAVCVLLPDNAVGPVRERRSSKDAGAFARADRAGGEMSRGQLLDDAEPNRLALTCSTHVACPCGVTVHRGVGPGRNGEPAQSVFGKYTGQRIVERNAEGGLLPYLIQDPLGCLSGAQRRRHCSRRSERSHARFASSCSQMVSWKRSTAQSALKSESSVTSATHWPAFVAAGS